jgi:hypothetical protein
VLGTLDKPQKILMGKYSLGMCQVSSGFKVELVFCMDLGSRNLQ